MVWSNTLLKEKNKMNYLYVIILSLFMIGCTTETEEPSESDSAIETKNTPTQEKEELVVVKGSAYQEFYPGKKNVKFEGHQDDQKRRHGKWSYYSEDGKELSTTMYEHGMKHGHMIVKYPNGAINYHGEMYKDKKIGVWKNYDENGELISETDFGEIE